MQRYVCQVCGYVYDPAVGDPDNGVAPGTAFADVPDDWICPVCSASKSAFVLEGAEAGVPESAPTVGDKIVEHLE